MSRHLLEQKRARLQNEIEVAKSQLFSNIEDIHPTDYLPSTKDLIPSFASSILAEPSNFLSQLYDIIKSFLPKDNIFASALNVLNILKEE